MTTSLPDERAAPPRRSLCDDNLLMMFNYRPLYVITMTSRVLYYLQAQEYSGNSSAFTDVTFNVTVSDVDDNKPIWEVDLHEMNVSEDTRIGTRLLTMRVKGQCGRALRQRCNLSFRFPCLSSCLIQESHYFTRAWPNLTVYGDAVVVSGPLKSTQLVKLIGYTYRHTPPPEQGYHLK